MSWEKTIIFESGEQLLRNWNVVSVFGCVNGKPFKTSGGVLVLTNKRMIFFRKKGSSYDYGNGFHLRLVVGILNRHGKDLSVKLSNGYDCQFNIDSFSENDLEYVRSLIQKEKNFTTSNTPEVAKEIIKEKEIIVKIRCQYCGNLFSETLDKCPHCGAKR